MSLYLEPVAFMIHVFVNISGALDISSIMHLLKIMNYF